MLDKSHSNYSHLDRPEVLMGLFHPRSEYGSVEKPANAIDLLIPVERDIMVGGRFHMAGKSAPNVLFFHGAKGVEESRKDPNVGQTNAGHPC